jgi:low affinity Fe/Cu permease
MTVLARYDRVPHELGVPFHMPQQQSWFTHFAQWVAHLTGRPLAFLIALSAIVIWGISGPIFGFSDTWQLVINTGTTIVTFLMVFVIQNTQNRDTAALQIKLDEMIRVTKRARNTLLNLEDLDEETLEKLRGDYVRLAEEERPVTKLGRTRTVPGKPAHAKKRKR